MAVTVSLSGDRSLVKARQRVTVTASFVNGGSSAVTVTAVDRASPDFTASAIEDSAVKLGGLVLAANATTQAQFSILWPSSTGTDLYTLTYSFGFSDDTTATAGNIQVIVLDEQKLTSSQKVNFPTPGQLDFRANTQSALVGAI